MKVISIEKRFGPLVLDAQKKFIAVLPGLLDIENTALIKLPKFTSIYRFYFRATQGTIAHVNYVALKMRISQLKMAKHKEMPAFFPDILSKQNHLSMIVSDKEDEELMVEFDQTDDAVRWRKEYPQDIVQEHLVVVYSFERIC